MTINKVEIGLNDGLRSIEKASPWQTESRETAARLVFGALYQDYRYAWQQALIDESNARGVLLDNKPTTVVDGKPYNLSDKYIKEQSQASEQKLKDFYQQAIMESLKRCARACGRQLTPRRGTIIPKNLYGGPLLRLDISDIRDEICSVTYSPTLVLFGPENVDEAVRRSVISDAAGEATDLKKFLARNDSIAVVVRTTLENTFGSLERYYGDRTYDQFQSPGDQERAKTRATR